jgi:hypothetical protein
MVKICQTGLLKLNFETRPKKRIFRFLPKNFCRPRMKLKKFFGPFPNPWALRVSGLGGYTSKCEKNQNHCTLVYSCTQLLRPRTPPPHLGSYTRALLVSQDRRHLFLTPCMQSCLVVARQRDTTLDS